MSVIEPVSRGASTCFWPRRRFAGGGSVAGAVSLVSAALFADLGPRRFAGVFVGLGVAASLFTGRCRLADLTRGVVAGLGSRRFTGLGVDAALRSLLADLSRGVVAGSGSPRVLVGCGFASAPFG